MIFEYANFTKTYKEAIKNAVRAGARAFLRAAYPAVPVWTGQARAVFKALARATIFGRSLRVAIPISPVASRAGYSIARGAASANVTQIETGSQYGIEFNTDLFYFFFNENFNMRARGFRLKHPTPWKSLQKGRIAFILEAERILQRDLPRFKQFIKIEGIVSGNG